MSGTLNLRAEWHSADGITAPELAATFCRLELWLDHHCITRVEDRRGGGVRDGIYCPAYSLAEWLATRWWSLRNHVRHADRGVRLVEAATGGEMPPVDDLHDMRAATDGFIWPACVFSPEGEQTLVSWHARPAGASDPIAYLSSGALYVETNDLSRSFAVFIESVIERLEASGVSAPNLTEEWEAITGADEDEASFCTAAAALSLDPYDVDPPIALLLEKLGAALGDPVTIELAQAADPALLTEDFRWVQDAELRLRRRGGRSASLAPLRAAVSDVQAATRMPPYRLGYEQARAIRHVLRWDTSQRAEVERLVELERRPASDPALLGAAMARPDNLALVVGARGDTTARFVAGRALWRGLHTHPERPFLVTNATTWSHKVERAFAAELLAPATGISDLIGRPRVVALETVYELAQSYDVAPTLIRHQIENQLEAVVAY